MMLHRNTILSQLTHSILSLFPSGRSIVTSLEKEALLWTSPHYSINLFVGAVLHGLVFAESIGDSLFGGLKLIFATTAQ